MASSPVCDGIQIDGALFKCGSQKRWCLGSNAAKKIITGRSEKMDRISVAT